MDVQGHDHVHLALQRSGQHLLHLRYASGYSRQWWQDDMDNQWVISYSVLSGSSSYLIVLVCKFLLLPLISADKSQGRFSSSCKFHISGTFTRLIRRMFMPPLELGPISSSTTQHSSASFTSSCKNTSSGLNWCCSSTWSTCSFYTSATIHILGWFMDLSQLDPWHGRS